MAIPFYRPAAREPFTTKSSKRRVGLYEMISELVSQRKWRDFSDERVMMVETRNNAVHMKRAIDLQVVERFLAAVEGLIARTLSQN